MDRGGYLSRTFSWQHFAVFFPTVQQNVHIMTRILSICCYILIFGTISLMVSCKGPDACSNRQEIDLKFSQNLTIVGQNEASRPVTLIFPKDCDDFPYRGTYTARIVNPEVVPGLEFYFLQDTQRVSAWTNGFVPANGELEITLFASPKVVNGVPQTPTPGAYRLELSGRFSSPNENTPPLFLNVQVLPDDFTIVLEEPNREFQYPEGTNEVPLRALVSDQNSGIVSVGYRLDSGAWVYQQYPDQPNEVRLDTVLSNLTPGRHTIELEAQNAAGTLVTTGDYFNILQGNQGLIEVRWDAGGDGINWQDPLNWDNDRVPSQFNHVIVDLPETDSIRIAPRSFNQYVVAVGSFDINADVLIDGPAFEVAERNATSYFRRNLSFGLAVRGTQGSAFRFAESSNQSILEIQGTLFLSGAQFVAIRPGAVNPTTVRVQEAYYGPGARNLGNYAFVVGFVWFEFLGRVRQEQDFTWNIVAEDYFPARFINKGLWQLTGNVTFNNPNEFFSASIFNEEGARVEVRRVRANSEFKIEGTFRIVSEGTWTDFRVDPSIPVGKLILSSSSGFETEFDTLLTDAIIEADRGEININVLGRTPQLLLSSIYDPKVTIQQVEPTVGQIRLDNGTVTLGTGGFDFLYQFGQNSKVEVTSNLFIDSVVLANGVFKLGTHDTLSMYSLLWQSTIDSSIASSTNAFRLFKKIYPGGRESEGRLELFGSDPRLAVNFILRGATLKWLYGNPYTDFAFWNAVYIDQNSSFIFANQSALNWGVTATSYSGLYLYNDGVVDKNSGFPVEMNGCLINGPTGRTFNLANVTIVSSGFDCR